MLLKIYRLLEKVCAHVCIALILGIRPLLGPAECAYELSCTKFALQELKTRPIYRAIWKIVRRVLSCNPFSK